MQRFPIYNLLYTHIDFSVINLSHQTTKFLTTILIYVNHQFSLQFSSVTHLCPTLCNSMDCSMPGLPVHHQLLELTQTHVHWVSQWCHPTISSSVVTFSSHLQSFPASGSFPISQFFISGGQSIGVSAPASVLPKNIQDWFPLLDSLVGLPCCPRDS